MQVLFPSAFIQQLFHFRCTNSWRANRAYLMRIKANKPFLRPKTVFRFPSSFFVCLHAAFLSFSLHHHHTTTTSAFMIFQRQKTAILLWVASNDKGIGIMKQLVKGNIDSNVMIHSVVMEKYNSYSNSCSVRSNCFNYGITVISTILSRIFIYFQYIFSSTLKLI